MSSLITIIIALFISVGMALFTSYIKYKSKDPGIVIISIVAFFWGLSFLAAFALVCYLTNLILLKWLAKIIMALFF